MGDLAEDTAVEHVGGSEMRFRGDISSDWEIWGPNGGYVASIALRASAAASRFSRPASLSCHYLSPAAFGPAELDVSFLRQAKRAESLRVTMSQGAGPVLAMLVWMTDDGLEGLAHDHAVMPDIPSFADLRPIDELRAPDEGVRFSFFENVEQRPTEWIDDWENREPSDPRVLSWFRFRPTATFEEDPIVDACRSVILIDTMEWPAAARAHSGMLSWIAPSLDLTVHFHRFDPRSEWLLTDTTANVATEGLIGGAGAVWSPDGRLLASGSQQMLCRPFDPRR